MNNNRKPILIAVCALAVLTLILIIGIFKLTSYRSLKQTGEENSVTKPDVNQTPTPTQKPQIKVNVIYPQPDLYIDKGIFKASGIIQQEKDNFLLSTKFEKDVDIPSYGERKFNIVTFIPGRIKQISGIGFFLDNVIIENVYGFPQWPQILCDPEIQTEKDCINSQPDNIPPVVFFLKAPITSTNGSTTFEVTLGQDVTSTTIFKENYRVYESKESRFFDAGESCARGYYYQKEYLATPPLNETTYYRVLFPKNTGDTANINNSVYIKFDGELYDLIIPSSESLIGYEEQNPKHNLYLPLDLLYYKNNTKASVLIKTYDRDSGEYFEYLPVSRATLQILPSYFERTTSGWSGCDG